jgi:two-component system, OmpR family, response regulator
LATILVVDDDDHIREVIQIFLKQEGFTVYEAIDGIDALTRLETIQVDMVILDIMMPQMDGWELCRELRKYYDFPLLILTAKAESTDKLKGFRVGTDDYLTKPFETEEKLIQM